ncbi:DUF6383 domain-containing protein [Parabacteroides sp.]
MNRKISTLLTAGLLMAGSLCGSAWAKDINLPIGDKALTGKNLTSGKEVFMSINSQLYGFKEIGKTGDAKDKIIPAGVIGASSETMLPEEDLAGYIWTVTWTTGASEYSYKLVNKATGQTLRIKKDGSAVELNTKEEAKNTISLFLFKDDNGKSVLYSEGDEKTVNEEKQAIPTGLLTAVSSEGDVKLSWNKDGASVNADNEGDLYFYAVETPALTGVEGQKELNALYNGNGFSFGVSTPDDKPLEGNLFGDQRIVARYVSEAIEVDASTPSYVSQQIPVGMYFFVGEAPANNSYSAWLNATVLVASSYETIEATVSDRKGGQGYGLKAMKIKDLNLYVKDEDPNKDWMSQGKQVSILNACFTVNKTYVGSYPYALTLDNFRYQADASKAEHTSKKVRLNVIGHASTNYLATQVKDDPQFIFKLAASGMQKAIDMLNKEAKAAVYSIRILDGYKTNGSKISKSDIRSAYGKYLTNSINNGNFNFVAKANVLMTNVPAYQWAITDINVNTQDVTFTNRETNQAFTTKLFPVEGKANVYELALSEVNASEETSGVNVTPVYVDQNTYKETKGKELANLDKLTVELKQVEYDSYAGFLKGADKNLVTMAFARDNYETSNKLYAAVSDYTSGTNLARKLCASEINGVHEYFVNNASEAAQWQLIKKGTQKVVERSFVYNDNGVAVVAPKADVVYAEQYILQYVVDGEETHFFFDGGTNDKDLKQVDDEEEIFANAQKYIIKQNADGSVFLIKYDANKIVNASNPTFLDEGAVTEVTAVLNNNNKYVYSSTASEVYAIHSDDETLNTYLIVESPEVSYPAEEGYVYMESELGNYISMNEDRDGIVVNENPFNLFLHVTDKDAVIPSFYISRGIEGATDRAFLFHPQDSVQYYVADGKYDKKYEWALGDPKAIFKAGQISESRDTIATMIKGVRKNVAVKADDNGTFGGLKNFKFQIVLADDADDMYVVRSLSGEAKRYLYAVNEKLTWTSSKSQAMKFKISEGDPTSNESIADAAEGAVKVIAGNGVVEIQGAAGKKVIVSTILGKVIAETVLTSDNATIAVPAGFITVAVEGEEAVKAVVK